MSVKTSSRVWEYSPEKGSNLLALLAIADHADDYGVAWPGMERIAKKARVTERHAKRIVQDLEASGEVYIKIGGGRGNSNRYFITCGLDIETIKAILVKHSELGLSPIEAEIAANQIAQLRKKGDIDVTENPKKGDVDVTEKRVTSGAERVTSGAERVTHVSEKGDTAMSPEPSVTINKPPEEPSESHALPLETEIAMLTEWGRKNPGIADPNQDLKSWFKYRDEAIQVFVDNGGFLGRTQQERNGRREEILKLVQETGFDLQRWENSVRTSIILGGVANDNLGCVIATYRAGGDYGEMQRQRKNGGKDGSHRCVRGGNEKQGAGKLTPEQRKVFGGT